MRPVDGARLERAWNWLKALLQDRWGLRGFCAGHLAEFWSKRLGVALFVALWLTVLCGFGSAGGFGGPVSVCAGMQRNSNPIAANVPGVYALAILD